MLPVSDKTQHALTDPIDTASPQGKFTLQVLGATAEFERALIRERTKAGLSAARSQGRVGGNPGLRARDPAALRSADPGITLQAICDRLEAMRERTPRGRPSPEVCNQRKGGGHFFTPLRPAGGGASCAGPW